MRRLLATLLLLLSTLPVLAPLWAATPNTALSDRDLPACCRRNGAHHCGMRSLAQPSSTHQHTAAAPVEKCPFAPAPVLLTHPSPLHAPPSAAAAIFAGLLSHPTPSPQTASKWRIARDRSRGKRGPPPSLLLS